MRQETREASKEHKMEVFEGHMGKSGLCPKDNEAPSKGYKVGERGCML